MTTIAVATSRGTELSRIAELLSAFYSLLTKSTIYIEPLREGEISLFPSPPNTEGTQLVHIPLVGVDPTRMSQEIAASIRRYKKDGRTIIVSLPTYAQHVSGELLELIDLFLIQAIPSLQSIADAIRLLTEIHKHDGEQKLNVRPWILGAGCAGGPAIAARLRASAALALARDERTSLKPEDLPFLHWGMPLIHWSTWDHISGLGPIGGKALSQHIGRACHTLYRQTVLLTVLLTRQPDKAPTFDELAADSINFFEPWLIGDGRSLAQRHLDLGEDLSLIESGYGPIPEDFLDTAHLDEWGTTSSSFMALEGTVSNHPELTTGDWIRTSEVVAFGPGRQWARTLSRYYTLGTSAEGEQPATQTH